jgi:hypothetical protein
MEYSKKLIAKAKVSRCKVCWEYISESEADSCEFQATETSKGNFAFMHNKCISAFVGKKEAT